MVVVNPRQVRDFARATGKLAKTDALDAAVPAHFAEAVRPPVRPLRDAETQVLNSLVARRHQVMTMLVSEKNGLGSATTVTVRPRFEAYIAWLERELKDLDESLQRTLRQSPVWREKDDLLRTVPGVGDAPGYAPPSIWGRWWPAASIPSSGTSTSGCWSPVSRRSWPSQPACLSCSLSSTPCSNIVHHGAPLRAMVPALLGHSS